MAEDPEKVVGRLCRGVGDLVEGLGICREGEEAVWDP